MKKSICGADCTSCEFGKNNACKGCEKSKGCPFGKQCFIAKQINKGGMEGYKRLKEKLIEEFNALNVCGMPKIKELYPLNGAFVNLEYPIPSGKTVKLLDNEAIYLGNQVECELSDKEKCYGLVSGMDFLLVCEYGENGTEPEIVVYKKR